MKQTVVKEKYGKQLNEDKNKEDHNRVDRKEDKSKEEKIKEEKSQADMSKTDKCKSDKLKIDYDQAENYWKVYDKTTMKMPISEIKKAADEFLSSHNTAALATGYKTDVRCTPIEYCWLDGCIYMLSEGGMKFHSLRENKQVCIGIYESYQGFGKLASMQVTGKADILTFGCDEYKKVLAYKKIPEAAIERLNHPMYLIKVRPDKMELLFSQFKEKGYASRQQIEGFY